MNVDKKIVKKKYREFILSLGLDVEREGLVNTPRRVSDMYMDELFNGLYTEPPEIVKFKNDNNYYDEIIINTATIFSVCEHHFVPIKCKVYIGYIPSEHMCGISKLIRVAEWYAHRPQLQERLTHQIAEHLNKTLKPEGVMVIIKGEHMCEQMRGVEKLDSKMITSAVKGVFFEDGIKNEFLRLINL
jgi:GTP cyclohydrolase IA